uniref:Uncharacterized protein n=1 Tax=Anguilla anguilla TaxID=7936 RepID=A0A0E9SLG7_ANGAN
MGESEVSAEDGAEFGVWERAGGTLLGGVRVTLISECPVAGSSLVFGINFQRACATTGKDLS